MPHPVHLLKRGIFCWLSVVGGSEMYVFHLVVVVVDVPLARALPSFLLLLLCFICMLLPSGIITETEWINYATGLMHVVVLKLNQMSTDDGDDDAKKAVGVRW